MTVYVILNLLNGKKYVGQTVQRPDARFAKHCSRRKNSAISAAIHKYGAENFVIVPLWSCASYEEMNQVEVDLISLLGTISPNGYNLAFGGRNGRHLEETKRKISEAQKGEKNHAFGKKATPETRRKMSEYRKGRSIHSPEVRSRLSEMVSGENHPMFGKHHTEESRAKISQTLRERWANREHPSKGKTLSESHRKNISRGQMGRSPSPATLEKLRRNGARQGKKVLCRQTNQIFTSISEAARACGIRREHVRDILKGKRKSSKGLTFIKVDHE